MCIIGSVLLILLYTLYHWVYTLRTRNQKQVLMQIVENILFDSHQLTPSTIEKFNALGIQNSNAMQTNLVKILMQYSLFIKGEERGLINKIYRDVGLAKKDLGALQSPFPNQVIKALNKLGRFGIYVDPDQIRKLQKNKNSDIREVANLYVVGYFRDNVFDFLDFTEEPLTKWQQLEYFHVFINRKQVKIPEFSRWIRETYDPSVVHLAIEFAAHFLQRDASYAIENFLNGSTHTMRKTMIAALGKLGNPDSIPFLRNWYMKESNLLCKKSIIKSLSYLADKQSKAEIHHFLSEQQKNESSVLLQKSIERAIRKISSSADIARPMTPQNRNQIAF